MVCFATWEPEISPRDPFRQAQVLAPGCLWGEAGMSGNINKDVKINKQCAAGSNHHHWSSLGGGDEGLAAC